MPLVFAAAALPAGFAFAELTGSRALGGLMLAAHATTALVTSSSSRTKKATWLAILATLFVASHLLADPLGAWPAIAIATAIAGASAARLL